MQGPITFLAVGVPTPNLNLGTIFLIRGVWVSVNKSARCCLSAPRRTGSPYRLGGYEPIVALLLTIHLPTVSPPPTCLKAGALQSCRLSLKAANQRTMAEPRSSYEGRINNYLQSAKRLFSVILFFTDAINMGDDPARLWEIPTR